MPPLRVSGSLYLDVPRVLRRLRAMNEAEREGHQRARLTAHSTSGHQARARAQHAHYENSIPSSHCEKLGRKHMQYRQDDNARRRHLART